jgi:hypothetical protein
MYNLYYTKIRIYNEYSKYMDRYLYTIKHICLMEYSETGNFTKEQRAICRKISELVRTARKKGLTIKTTNDKLRAYLTDEANVAAYKEIDHDHPLKSLSCGQIDMNTRDTYSLFWQEGDFDD